MKSRQVTALLLSAIMTVSACMPMNGISAIAAENAGAASTETAAVLEPESEEQEAEAPAEEAEAAEGTTELVQAEEQEPAEEAVESAVEAEEPAEQKDEAEETEEPAAKAEEAEEPEESEAAPAKEPEEASVGKSAAQQAATVEEAVENEKGKEPKMAAKPTEADLASAGTISLGESIDVNLSQGSFALYKFVPEEDFKYIATVRSEDAGDLEVFIYYEDLSTPGYYGGNSSEGYNTFETVLRGGATYYIYVAYNDDVENASVSLNVKKGLYVKSNSDDITCKYGEEVVLSVSAQADEPITYRWYYNGEVIGTDSELHFTPEKRTEIECQVEAGDEYEFVYFTLTANRFSAYVNATRDYDMPDGCYYMNVQKGDPAYLYVDVSAEDESMLTIQWSKKDGDVYRDIEGATERDYTTEEITERETYKCAISDGYGNDVEFYIDVRIENNLVVYAGEEGGQYASLYPEYGETVPLSVSVSADDSSNLSYQWAVCSIYDDMEGDIEGATSSSYTVGPLYEPQKYRCYVTDGYGNKEFAEFYIDVTEPYFELWAEDSWVTADPSDNYWPTLQVYADTDSGVDGDVTYQWYRNDQKIAGATSSSYALKPGSKAGTYRCEAIYKKIADYVNIDVTIENGLWADAADRTTYEVEKPGDSAVLEVEAGATDKTNMKYVWRDGDGNVISGATGTKYTVPSVTEYQRYTCTVYDRYENTETVYFYVTVQNDLYAYPEGGDKYSSYKEISVSPYESVTLKVITTARDMTGLTYTWQLPDQRDEAEGSDTLTLDSVDQGGEYHCTVTDRYGNTSGCTFDVRINNHFSAYALEDGKKTSSCTVKVPYGQTAELEVFTTADITDGITYDWQYYESDDKDINGKTFVTDPVEYYTNYTCEVRDKFGNCELVYFYVYVDNKLSVSAEGYGENETVYIYGDPGDTVELKAQVTALDMDSVRVFWEDNYYGRSIEGTYDPSTGKASCTATIDGDKVYRCNASDEYGNDVSVEFYVRQVDNFIVYPEGADLDENGNYKKFVDIYATPGQKLDLRVIASNESGSLDYYWRTKEVYPTSWGEYDYDYDYMDAHGDSVSITANTSCEYRCSVSDRNDNYEYVYFYIHIGGVSAYPVDPATGAAAENGRVAIIADQGEKVTLKVNATATGDSKLTYKWTEGPLNDSGWWPLEKENTTDTLTVTPGESRRYLCVVTDQYQNQSLCYFYVNVNGMKLSSNQGTPVLDGDNEYTLDVLADPKAELTLQTIVTAASTDGISYEWKSYEWSDEVLSTSDAYTFVPEEYDREKVICKVTDASGQKAWITYNIIKDNQLAVTPVGPGGPEAGKTAITINAKKGDSVKLSVVASASDMEEVHYDWRDSANRICGGSESCTIKVTGNGTYSCTVYDKYYNEKTVYFHIVTGETSLASTQITLDPNTYTYDGTAKKPAVTVKYNGTTLVAGRDYAAPTYEDNINAGTASVYVKGMGNYAGTRRLTFTIAKASQPSMKATLSSAKIAVGATSKMTVSGIKESAKLTYSSSSTAIATVNSSGTITAKKVGTAKITVKAAETTNYKAASKTLTVTVLPAATAKFTATAASNGKGLKLTWTKVAGATKYILYRNGKKIKTLGNVATYTDPYANTNGTKYTYKIYAQGSTGISTKYKSVVYYKLNRPSITSLTNLATKKMKVQWGKNSKATGYIVQYSLSSSFSSPKTVTIKKYSQVATTISKLTKGKTYYVRVRSYKTVSKVNYYSAWSASKKVKISK